AGPAHAGRVSDRTSGGAGTVSVSHGRGRPRACRADGILAVLGEPGGICRQSGFPRQACTGGPGALNAWWLHAGRHWRGVIDGGPVHAVARLHALFSILLWLGAIVAGRWIGFL